MTGIKVLILFNILMAGLVYIFDFLYFSIELMCVHRHILV